MSHSTRFTFIRHALDGSGPFRPVVTYDGTGKPLAVGQTYLVRYPRESDLKFSRRNELAWYTSPLAAACSRFVGYLSMRPPVRAFPHPLYEAMAEDIDGRGNNLEVFWGQFATNAKARGTMLLLVDMPADTAANLADQVERRVVPYFSPLNPEAVTDYQVGDDGKFDFVEFRGTWSDPEGKKIEVTWHFDRQAWEAKDRDNKVVTQGEHPLGECPVLIFTEGGEFPHFGPFAELADLARRLFNAQSELDEILRAQTFSLLTMQVPDGTTDKQKIESAKAVGETIGTNNLLVHTGATPAFIAPPEGPAKTYLETIAMLEKRIDEISLKIETPNAQEAGIALQMRFHALNSALSSFAMRLEDLERRAWDLAAKWLTLSSVPTIQWRRDFALADVAVELAVLTQMQMSAMPPEVVAEQEKRIVSIQFGGLDQDQQDEINRAIDEKTAEVKKNPPDPGDGGQDGGQDDDQP